MRKIDYYRVTIHYWPGAAEANLKPQITTLFGGDDGPQYYIPHSIDFQDKPLRKDLIAAIRQVPWMAHSYLIFIGLIELNPFPLVSNGCKAESQDLFEQDGKCYGRIEIRREYMFENGTNRDIPLIPFEVYHNHRRTEAVNRYLERNQNRIKEIAMELPERDIKKAVAIFLKRYPFLIKDLANA